jgi:protein SMG6
MENALEKETEDAIDESSTMSDDFDDWRHMYPSIKIFIDWMLCNANMWQPMPDQLPPDLGPNPDRWKIMANMFNLVQKLSTRLEILLEKKIDAQSKNLIRQFLNRVKLEEDLEVAGFVPLLSLSPRADYDYQNKYDTNELNRFLNDPNLNSELIELAKMKKRSEKLCLFAEYLCGLEQPILKYDVLNKCYSQIVGQILIAGASSLEFNRSKQLKNESNVSNRTISTCSSSSMKSETDLINMESSLLNSMMKSNLNDDSEQSILLNDLKEKRRLLKAKMQEQQKREKSHQSIIEMSVQRQLELEIHPKFIVPDTNCFIDHLNLIDRILATSYYIVVVPLLVINELDKLSKSIAHCNDDSIEHAEYVKSNACQAIKYLNEKFDKRIRNLKALTSQGSVLETIQFRSEEVRKQVRIKLKTYFFTRKFENYFVTILGDDR